MPGVSALGALRAGWRAEVPEYPIAAAWAPDGRAVVVLDAAGGLTALDGASGERRWSVADAHPGGGLALAAHPSRPRVATGGQDGTLALWDAHSGALVRRVALGAAWVEHLAWSADGRRLAAAAGRDVGIVAEGAEDLHLPAHPGTVGALAWSSAGLLVTACYGRVALWRGGEPVETLRWKGSLVSLAIRPDASVVACGTQDRAVHFWRRPDGGDSEMTGYANKPTALAFDTSGTLLATNGGSTVTVWSFADGGPEGTSPGQLEAHTLPVTTLAFARGERLLATGGREGGVVLWRLDTRGGGAPVGGATVPAGLVQVAWRPDQRALVGTDADGGVTTWRVSR